MKNIFYKVIILILTICLCGCDVVPVFREYAILNYSDDFKSDDFIYMLRNYRVRGKNKENTKEDEKFNEFLHDVVVDIYEDSYVSMHYDFVDYRSFGIEKPEVSWGEIDEDKEEYIQKDIDLVNKLHEFNYYSLSYSQQFDYEALEYSLYEDLASLTVDFDSVLLFDSRTNLLSSMIDELNDFIFYDKESLDDYMVLLADSDRYLKEAIDYTNKTANENGYYMVDYSIDLAEEYIDSFIKGKPNALISSFNERINKIDFIDASSKNKYKEENKKIINEEIIPVIKEVRETIESQRGKTCTEENRLINISEDLAEETFMLDISYNESIDTIFSNSCSVLVGLINELIYLINDETVQSDIQRIAYGKVEPLNDNFNEMLEFLEDNYTQTNPDIGYINYELSSLDASSASDSIIAYYWPSPIDRADQNIIKYNPNSIEGDEPWSSYFTIAHEGIPGHMYDFSRSLSNNENPIRRVISFIGVSEGYAKYSEMCAASYLDIDEKTQRYLAIDAVNGYIFDGILDLAINYYNYSDDQLKELINYLGYNVTNIEYLKNFFADEYGVLTRYGIGLSNILYLKEKTKQDLGDKFNEVEFNDLLTRNGRLPFVIVEDEINKYIKEKLES